MSENEIQPISPRRRMQELLAIPDSQRTDEQWDELNELEIQLSPVNRDRPADREGRRSNNGPRAPSPSKNQGAAPAPKKTFRKFHKKSPKVPPTV